MAGLGYVNVSQMDREETKREVRKKVDEETKERRRRGGRR
jgi:hypothetical protein